MNIQQVERLPDDVQKEYFDFQDVIWFVSYNDKAEWMGFGGIRMDMSDYPYFGPTYVKPEHRGLGLQRKLIEAREEWCRKNGYSGLTSCAYEANLHSRKNLEACGFKKLANYCDEIWYFKSIGK